MLCRASAPPAAPAGPTGRGDRLRQQLTVYRRVVSAHLDEHRLAVLRARRRSTAGAACRGPRGSAAGRPPGYPRAAGGQGFGRGGAIRPGCSPTSPPGRLVHMTKRLLLVGQRARHQSPPRAACDERASLLGWRGIGPRVRNGGIDALGHALQILDVAGGVRGRDLVSRNRGRRPRPRRAARRSRPRCRHQPPTRPASSSFPPRVPAGLALRGGAAGGRGGRRSSAGSTSPPSRARNARRRARPGR